VDAPDISSLKKLDSVARMFLSPFAQRYPVFKIINLPTNQFNGLYILWFQSGIAAEIALINKNEKYGPVYYSQLIFSRILDISSYL